MTVERKTAAKRPVEERIKDYREIYINLSDKEIMEQASRCMDCGIPFCMNACPLGNYIPDFNALVSEGQWKKALEALHATNNFPEFTGRLCPALCEASCVRSLNGESTTNRQVELAIVEKGWEKGWIVPHPPARETGYKVAVVGSGPSGLATAQQLRRAGHQVTVFERSNAIGGILARGIPDYKLGKDILERRISQLEQEGIVFRTGMNVGQDLPAEMLTVQFDAICLAGGSTVPRDLDVRGRELEGIHFAMDYLVQQNLKNDDVEICPEEMIDAKGKNVVIIGGGDTGADCLGTAVRQGAANIYQLEIMPKPPEHRTDMMPWPEWPMIFRSNSSHEEGGERDWSVATQYFSGEEGKVKKIHCVRLEWGEPDETGRKKMIEIPGSEFTIDADLVIFAMGFVHPERKGLLEDLGVGVDARGNVAADDSFMTAVPGIFAAGDMRRGQSLVCWAISEGRKVAREIDKYLMGFSDLKTAL